MLFYLIYLYMVWPTNVGKLSRGRLRLGFVEMRNQVVTVRAGRCFRVIDGEGLHWAGCSTVVDSRGRE